MTDIADVTVAIVTRKRPEYLSRCLLSIIAQTWQPKTVLIVDNDTESSAYPVYQAFQDKLPLRYIRVKKMGVPVSRNRAIDVCNTLLLGFVDDDCVLDREWVGQVKKAFDRPKISFVLGRSELYNPQSPVANALQLRQTYWFNREYRKQQSVSPFMMDTKNVAFRVAHLKKKKLTFDQKLFIDKTDGHSDTDFGFQLAKAKLEGCYQPGMVLYHEETESIKNFIRKAYWRGRAGAGLAKKWQLKNELVYLPDANWVKFWWRALRYWPVEYRLWLEGCRELWWKKSVPVLSKN